MNLQFHIFRPAPFAPPAGNGPAASLLTGNFETPRTVHQWFFMLLLVLLCSCFGFAFQPLGQKYLPAEEAAVLTVVNPFTASMMGVLVAGENLTVSKCAGYALILSALIIYNTGIRNGN